jgi:hypothetical protein
MSDQDLRDTRPPTASTRLPGPAGVPEIEAPSTEPEELGAVFDAIEQVRRASEEHNRTIGTALNSLRTTVLEHYDRTTRRLDAHADEIRRIKIHIGLADRPSSDGL